MEFFRFLKKEFEIATWQREQKRKTKALERFFQSTTGREHIERALKDLGIENITGKEILAVDNEFKEFRLTLNMENDTFRDFVHNHEPRIINYHIRHQTDEMDMGDLLVVVDDKIAVKTSGIIFPQVDSVKGILSGIEGVSYRAGKVDDYSNPWNWRPLILNDNLER